MNTPRWLAFYRPATGEIVQVAYLSGNQGMVAAMLGCKVMEITQKESARVRGVSYVKDSRIIVAGDPPRNREWDWKTLSWTDPRTISDLRAQVWSRMKTARAAATAAPFEMDGMKFDAGPLSVAALNTQATAAANHAGSKPFEVLWTLADNTTATLTRTQLLKLQAGVAQRAATVHNQFQALREQVDAAPDRGALESLLQDTPFANVLVDNT